MRLAAAQCLVVLLCVRYRWTQDARLENDGAVAKMLQDPCAPDGVFGAYELTGFAIAE